MGAAVVSRTDAPLRPPGMTQTTSFRDVVTVELLERVRQSTERTCRSVEGLTEGQVREPAAPSGWTIAGLVGHVRDSTWFRLHHVVAGHPTTVHDDAWDNDPDLPMTQLLDLLRADTGQACAASEHLASNDAPGWWPEGAWGGYLQDTIRGVLFHLLQDNVAHTGHLDIAREQIDGGVWDYGLDAVRRPGRTTTDSTSTMTAEARALQHFLDAQRASVLAIIDGLTDEQLRTAVLPTGWTPLGLVQHLGHAEHHRFQSVTCGAASDLPWPDNGRGQCSPPAILSRRSLPSTESSAHAATACWPPPRSTPRLSDGTAGGSTTRSPTCAGSSST